MRLNTDDYFDQLYQDNDDPWHYQQRWYEQRKRQLCLAALPQAQFQRVLEIGCSNGIFSELLAPRCQQLICVDAHRRAVELAQARLARFAHVQVRQQRVPETHLELENGGLFDLIILSEVAYYLRPAELVQLMQQLQQCLSADGTLLACHWRYPIAGFELNGDQVHACLRQQLALHHYLQMNDPDFLLDLWTQDAQSVAAREGLI